MPQIGLGFRRGLKTEIIKHKKHFNCVEIVADSYLHVTKFQIKELLDLYDSFTILPHGLRLSIGSVERPPQSYLDSIVKLLDITQPPYYSDHFAITDITYKTLGHLSPIWYTDRCLEIVINNIQSIQSFLGIPLVFETITHPFEIPCGTMSQEQFITLVCQETGCGILLDITNIFINSQNFGNSPEDFIKNLPRDYRVQCEKVT